MVDLVRILASGPVILERLICNYFNTGVTVGILSTGLNDGIELTHLVLHGISEVNPREGPITSAVVRGIGIRLEHMVNKGDQSKTGDSLQFQE